MGFRINIATILMVIQITVPGYAESEQLGKKDLRVMARMLFGQNYARTTNQTSERLCLQKWQSDIAVVLNDNDTVKRQNIVHRTLENFASITNRPYHIVAEDQLGSLQIQVVDVKEVTDQNYKAFCSATRKLNEFCEITGATVTIPANLDNPQFSYCLYHELMHAFGFQGHVWNKESVLNPKLSLTSLTDWDILALKSLYQDNLTVGSGIKATISAIKHQK